MPVEEQLANVFSSERFQRRVKEYLVEVPELKHEAAITTQLRIGLSLDSIVSRREVRDPSQVGIRHDLRIGQCTFIEAKYHFEGDVASVTKSLRRAAEDSEFRRRMLGADSRKTAARDMVIQATRLRGAHRLLWMVLVRPPESSEIYCLPSLIRSFYRGNPQNLENGVLITMNRMVQATVAFEALRGSPCSSMWLPRVESERGILLTLVIGLQD